MCVKPEQVPQNRCQNRCPASVDNLNQENSDAKRDSGDDPGNGPRDRRAPCSGSTGGRRSGPHRLVRHHHDQPPQSKDFYGKLFDWQFTPVQGTDQAAEIVAGGTAIGTLRVAEGQIAAFNGVVYVQVTDIQANCKKARELGATIPPGFPFDLPDGIGAIALVVDPAGHPIGLYSRTPLAPAPAPE